MRHEIKKTIVTCDQCGSNDITQALGIRIQIGHCQPDHRNLQKEVRLPILRGDVDVCMDCLFEIINGGHFIVYNSDGK